MDFNVTVTITLSELLYKLLDDKLPNLGRRVNRAVTKELGAKIRQESKVNIQVSAAQAEAIPDAESLIINDSPKTAIKVTPVLEPQPEVAEAPVTGEPQAMAAEPEMSPREMIRQIIHRTHQRFEGEDYLENTGTEAYKKYHRALNSQFKKIALALGYDKPTSIDTLERVEAFAADCDALFIGEDGCVAAPAAPF